MGLRLAKRDGGVGTLNKGGALVGIGIDNNDANEGVMIDGGSGSLLIGGSNVVVAAVGVAIGTWHSCWRFQADQPYIPHRNSGVIGQDICP